MVLRALLVRDAKRRRYRASNDTGSGGRRTRIDDVSYRMLYITRITIMLVHTEESDSGIEWGHRDIRSERKRTNTDTSSPAVRVEKSLSSKQPGLGGRR
jgi:hypothetical protein